MHKTTNRPLVTLQSNIKNNLSTNKISLLFSLLLPFFALLTLSTALNTPVIFASTTPDDLNATEWQNIQSEIAKIELTTTASLTVTKITASDVFTGDEFSYAVAIDGDTAVIGSRTAVNDSGAVYIFVRQNGAWNEQQKLTASDAVLFHNFGYSVAIDGDTVIIGAISDRSQGVATGAAYIFVRNGETWTEQQKLIADDAQQRDRFGQAVAIDGDTAVIGAYGKGGPTEGDFTGAAYVFTRTIDTWSQQQKLVSDNPAVGDKFGFTVAVTGDVIFVGAISEDDTWNNSGSAYVFTRTQSTWGQQQKLIASDVITAGVFGASVAVEGNTAVIGAYNSNGSKGAAYIFTKSGDTWSEQKILTASDASSGDSFGYTVALSGETIVVGAYTNNDGGNNTGSAYVFTGSGASWSEQEKLTASDASANDWFGRAVAVSNDTMIISAYYHNDGGDNSGSAYIYEPLIVNHTLNLNISGNGAVTSNQPDPISATNVYSTGTVVTLTAVANPSWLFDGWSGSCGGTATCVLTMNSTQNVTATFTTYPVYLPMIITQP